MQRALFQDAVFGTASHRALPPLGVGPPVRSACSATSAGQPRYALSGVIGSRRTESIPHQFSVNGDLQTLPREDFPTLPAPRGDATEKVAREHLRGMVTRTQFATLRGDV